MRSAFFDRKTNRRFLGDAEKPGGPVPSPFIPHFQLPAAFLDDEAYLRVSAVKTSLMTL